MTLILLAITLLVAWHWADWKNWREYHATMLYVAAGNLLYNFIYSDHLLWFFKADYLGHVIDELLFTFIVLPLTALILLSNYPSNRKKQILYIIGFIAVYMVMEWIYYLTGQIYYSYGWNILWSALWDCMMFPVWILHHKKPLIAYIASVFVVVLMLLIFPINFQ